MKKIFVILFLILGCLASFFSCDTGDGNDESGSSHIHNFCEWQITKKPTCEDVGEEERSCSCGEKEVRKIESLGHSEVVDAAIAPTCTQTGLTEGKHCSVCNMIIIEQTVIENLPATEINTRALKYVGEIITYDKLGNALSVATGFVYTRDGKIITNYHVIDGAYSAEITINNKTYKIALVLAYDRIIDLAVLKVDSVFNDYASFCSKEIAVGSTVYAIGSSRGLTNTFSKGIVTYYDRIVDGVSHLQHDASITSGNSGGPLINEYGEVVGINTWEISNSQNLNFAVFASEINNLVFGTPMTMAELYEINFSPYDLLKEWIKNNYNEKNAGSISFRYEYPDYYFYQAGLSYHYNSDNLCVDSYYVFDNGDSVFFAITLSETQNQCHYQCIYKRNGSNSDNVLEGYINANTFSLNSSLNYYSYEGDNTFKKYISEHLAQNQAVDAIYFLDWVLNYYQTGLNLNHFGFTSFN